MRKFITGIKSKLNSMNEPQENLENEDGYVELDSEAEDVQRKVIVRRFILKEFEDIKEILEALRKSDTVAFINIKPLKDKDLPELKRAINKLKKTCDAIDGEVAGFGDEWIVAAPSFATIYKTKQQSLISESEL
ncbi:MAG: cell division protein SepF [Candidatus Woesearchaeota archaeon]